MLKEYLSNIADQFRTHLDTTEPINAQDFADKIGEVYDKGLLEGLAQAKAEGRKTKYIEEYFTGSKQYLNYSIDFEPKLIIFLSNENDTNIETNKPTFEVNTLNIPKMIFSCEKGFAENQEYMIVGASMWRYKGSENTLNKVFSSTTLTEISFNEATGKWDVTLGRADSTTANTRFVSSGQLPSQIMIVGDKEEEQPSVLEGTITVLGTPKELRIEGLPKEPKTFSLLGCNQSLPPSGGNAVYWVRGLEYLADGFVMQESGSKITAMTWLSLATDFANTGGGNVSIPATNKDRVFKFENGTFIIDWVAYSVMYFGENFTYKWIATF